MYRIKKEYVAPRVDVVRLDAEPLLAASYRELQVNDTQWANPEIEVLGKQHHFNVWDDEE